MRWKTIKHKGKQAAKLPMYWLAGIVWMILFLVMYPIRVGRVNAKRMKKIDWLAPEQWW